MSIALEAFRKVPEIVNADDALVRRGRFLDAELLVGIGGMEVRLEIARGRIAGLHEGTPLLRSCDFSIRADEATWLAHWQPVPTPQFYDLFALTKAGLARIEGDMLPFMANLQYVKDVLASPRRLVAEAV